MREEPRRIAKSLVKTFEKRLSRDGDYEHALEVLVNDIVEQLSLARKAARHEALGTKPEDWWKYNVSKVTLIPSEHVRGG